jgi:hypothetical protein
MLMNKSELAKRRFGEEAVFDCALPQGWVNEMADQGIDVRPNFVWLYPAGNPFGHPAAVSPEFDELIEVTNG